MLGFESVVVVSIGCSALHPSRHVRVPLVSSNPGQKREILESKSRRVVEVEKVVVHQKLVIIKTSDH